MEPNETPEARRKRFDSLDIHAAPAHPESRLLSAELALAAEDFPAARKALGDLAETDPTTRSLALMAAIERGQGAPDAVVRGWLARALDASRGPQWICDKCNQVHTAWVPVCENCGAFDTLDWKTAPIPPIPGSTARPCCRSWWAIRSRSRASSGSAPAAAKPAAADPLASVEDAEVEPSKPSGANGPAAEPVRETIAGGSRHGQEARAAGAERQLLPERQPPKLIRARARPCAPRAAALADDVPPGRVSLGQRSCSPRPGADLAAGDFSGRRRGV